MRFIAPKGGDAKGVVRERFFGTDKIGFAVTRADIAAFTAAQARARSCHLGTSS